MFIIIIVIIIIKFKLAFLILRVLIILLLWFAYYTRCGFISNVNFPSLNSVGNFGPRCSDLTTSTSGGAMFSCGEIWCQNTWGNTRVTEFKEGPIFQNVRIASKHLHVPLSCCSCCLLLRIGVVRQLDASFSESQKLWQFRNLRSPPSTGSELASTRASFVWNTKTSSRLCPWLWEYCNSQYLQNPT